jgi:PAS domain S-box-containing protein
VAGKQESVVSTPATVLVLSAQPERAADTVAELRGLGYDVPGPVAPLERTADDAQLPDCDVTVLDLEQFVVIGTHPFECLKRPFTSEALRAAVELARNRHAARAQLHSDEDRYRDLVENSYDLICTHDAEGKLLSVNAAAEKALGYPRDALLGRSLQELLVPETRALFPIYLTEILEKGSAHGVMRMSAANGDVREWEYHNSERRLPNGQRIIRGLAHDVTEQLKAARELRASEQRFRALFEQAAVGVAYIETNSGKLLEVNQKCARILGYEPEELLAISCKALLHPAEVARYTERLTQLERGELTEFVMELRLLGKGDVSVWVALSVSLITGGSSRSPRHIVVVQDIAQRKLAEQQREILEAQLRQAQKMEAIGTLAGGIAHDFNNLLTAMVGNIDLARLEMAADHPANASLDAVAAAARRATELVRQILAFSRKQPSQRSVVALAPLIADCARLLRASLPAEIEINLNLDATAPFVMADATQIHQVVMNLATNAWQAITEKRGRIEITLDTIEVAAGAPAGTPPGRYARISVRDTGEGMDERTLERIFEPFFTTKATGRGSGLGLSVAHGIVKEHGGAISARSREGHGATFDVLLPAAIPGSAAVPATEPALTEPVIGHGNVLSVDDEKTLSIAVARMLESLGYRTTVCNSGAEAIDLVRQNPGAFDVVLTDLSMPGLSGTDVAREVLRIRPGLPVVLTSGYAERAGENLAAHGICLRLDKPFDRVTLSAALSQVRAKSIKAAG